VAHKLFLDRGGGGKTEIAKIGNAKQRSTLELESFCPEKKKRSLPDFGAFSCPKHG